MVLGIEIKTRRRGILTEYTCGECGYINFVRPVAHIRHEHATDFDSAYCGAGSCARCYTMRLRSRAGSDGSVQDFRRFWARAEAQGSHR